MSPDGQHQRAPHPVEGALLSRLVEDHAAGRPETLASYLAIFPGHEELVARLYHELLEETSPQVAPRSERAPERIAHFELLEEIGRGGQSVVYRAHDEKLDRVVALKLLRGGRAPRADELLRFQREIRVAARLNHPGICPVYDAGVDGAAAWVAMGLVEGSTLAERIAEGAPDAAPDALPDRDAIFGMVRILAAAARALHVAHESGVVHRDIKPANIMIRDDGSPVIVDFGLARVEADESLTLTGDVFGTPSYMAPEQLRGPPHDIDRRTDVHALGAALYHAVTRRRPHEGAGVEAVFQAILSQTPRAPHDVNPHVPRDLAVVIERCLEKSPDDRYLTALELADELDRVLRHEPILARPAGIVTRLTRWARRNPPLAGAVLSAFGVLILALVMAVWFSVEMRGLAKEKADETDRANETARRLADELADAGIRADLRRISELRRAADDLWPALERSDQARATWLAAARSLLERAPARRAALAEIRRDPARTSPRPEGPTETARLARFEVDRADFVWRNDFSHLDEPEMKMARAMELARTGRLRRLLERGPPSPGDPAAPLVEIVDGLDDLGHLVRAVRLRTHMRRAVNVRWPHIPWPAPPESGGPAEVSRIEGLVPLGVDPTSELHEFAVIGSGRIPTRDADGELLLDPAFAIVLILVPGGTQRVGAQSTSPAGVGFDPHALPNEGPPIEVSLAPFLISKFEMTQSQWYCLTGSMPSRYVPTWSGSSITNPVEQITWTECATVLPRIGLTLPTEAQWERAARAGTDTAWFTGAARRSIEGHANVADRTFASARYTPASWSTEQDLDDGLALHGKVHAARPNGWGLHGVIGNVMEWCADATYYGYGETPPRSPHGRRELGGAQGHMVRGSSYRYDALWGRSSARQPLSDGVRRSDLGVRPVMLLP